MVMEKSWNMKNLPNFFNFAPELYQIYMSFFATTKKLSINVESPHFPMFSAKCRECKIEKRDSYGKLRNDNIQMVMEKSWKSILSVGTWYMSVRCLPLVALSEPVFL